MTSAKEQCIYEDKTKDQKIGDGREARAWQRVMEGRVMLKIVVNKRAEGDEVWRVTKITKINRERREGQRESSGVCGLRGD